MLIGKRLHSYLAYAVLDRKSMHLAKRAEPRKGPPRDEAYKDWIRTQACLGCNREGRSEAAHVGNDGGMSMKASDYSCVPLCRDCHTQGRGAYHRVGKRIFERAHGLDFAAEVRRLNAKWQEVA